MHKIVLLITISLFSIDLVAQNIQKDSTSKFINNFSGGWRNYFMSTTNKGDLKDFYGLATGGNLNYSQPIKGIITVNLGAFFSVNTNIQDLSIPDPTTGKLSRYEAGLFDVQDLTKTLIPVLGIANITINKNNNELILGRMNLKSPFINSQDGRMIPTFEEGLWYSNSQIKNVKIGSGIFYKIAPRSTSKFFSIGESIGQYPSGRSITGTPSAYTSNTTSRFIVVSNVLLKPTKNYIVHLWNYYTDNIHNTTYLRQTFIPTKKPSFSISAEWLHQEKTGDGGNQDLNLAYYQFERSDLAGIQLKNKGLTLSYNYIFPHGQFVFPREWGRENIFTFQKRERSEGSAANHGIVISYRKTLKVKESVFNTEINVGRQFKPATSSPEKNKYALPSYYQTNLDLFYSHNKLPGWKAELLLTYKKSADNITQPLLLLNKVDLLVTNVIINYTF
ncbi:MAG: OprD family outer membrane porin [Cyclobacteriaceae bacterium]|nr:OprD family outer membrane porin [Cyclobacteriaceae bacterium]